MIIPGSAGEYGVTAGHSPIVAELKPGVIQVLHEAVSSAVRACTRYMSSRLAFLSPYLPFDPNFFSSPIHTYSVVCVYLACGMCVCVYWV